MHFKGEEAGRIQDASCNDIISVSDMEILKAYLLSVTRSLALGKLLRILLRIL